MEESKEERISRLVREGLDHYGFGCVTEAILAWKEVLSLDPDHREAKDYIKTADRRKVPREEPTERTQQARDDMVAESNRLLEQGELDTALELLISLSMSQSFDIQLEATIELVRSSLHEQYLEALGDLAGVPEVLTDPKEITKFNLSPDAGFLLSMVDGVTPLESLISLSGMDSFHALRTAIGLIDAGIVRMDT
jgi:hypothetical protein